MNRTCKLLLLALIGCASSVQAQEPLSLDELVKAFGWDFESAEIKVEQLGEGFYALFGIGGNILVSVGKDGTLLVDDQFPQLMPKIEAALTSLGSDGVDFVINTHWHFDHAEGNLHFWPGWRALNCANQFAQHDGRHPHHQPGGCALPAGTLPRGRLADHHLR